jgi:hypothetical protein
MSVNSEQLKSCPFCKAVPTAEGNHWASIKHEAECWRTLITEDRVEHFHERTWIAWNARSFPSEADKNTGTAVQVEKESLVLIETWLCKRCAAFIHTTTGAPDFCSECGAEFETHVATPRPKKVFLLDGNRIVDGVANLLAVAVSEEAGQQIVTAVNSYDPDHTTPDDDWFAMASRHAEAVAGLAAALKEILNFGVEFDDPRLDYIVAHVDNDAIKAARTALRSYEEVTAKQVAEQTA